MLSGAGVAGAGVIGLGRFGDSKPEPVVLGGETLRGALPVVIGDDADGGALVLAVVPLLFQPATTIKPIKANTARPAIQPHIPPTASSRRNTGSLKRGSVNLGSDMAFPPKARHGPEAL